MKFADKYVKLIEWSDKDQCYIGSCPELFWSGCHGNNPREVFNELCEIVGEMIEIYQQEGKQLPLPLSGKEYVNVLQKIA